MALSSLLRREARKFSESLRDSSNPYGLPDQDWRDLIVYRDTSKHAQQHAFVESDAKRIIARAGRRGGKTVGFAQKAVKRFAQGQRVLYATPTAEQIDRFWYEVKLALAEPIARGILHKNETEHTIEVPGTLNRIRGKTAWNADTLRGDYGDFLIFDEWQLSDEEAWERVGMPMLLDNNGDAAFAYTPPSLHSRSASKARDPRHAAKLFKRAQADTSGLWETYHFTSHDNPYISEEALELISGEMTSLAYQQEILAEDDVDIPGALWKQADIDYGRLYPDRGDSLPDMRRITVNIDPMGSTDAAYAECGIVVTGVGTDGHFYVLEDISLNATPDGWARAAVQAYYRWNADRIIAESNYGGQMVESTIKTVDKNAAVTSVTATRGKLVRAEPVAALYEERQRKAHHVGDFPQLEDEMTSYTGNGKSPNRMDALVWGGNELMLGGQWYIGSW